jgi:hypothetical protein
MMTIVSGPLEDISVQEESEANASGSPEPNVVSQNISIEKDHLALPWSHRTLPLYIYI